MTFGEEWGWGATKRESKKMFDTFAEAGGNLIDTANRYTDGTSEMDLGEFIKSDREHFDEVMRALDDVVRQGKVLYIGISDTPAWIVSQANTLADLRGWSPFVGLQIRYSLIDRTAEADLLPMARAFDLAVTPWSVLGAGVLTGKYNRKTQPEEGRAREGAAKVERNLTIAGETIDVAEEVGCSPSQVAIAWLRQHPGVMIPLIGARNRSHLEDNLGALEVTLGEDQLKRLDEASRIDLGFPHNFLAEDPIRNIVYGGVYDKIHNHRLRWSGGPGPSR